jgi:hypothetical protein
MPLTLLPTFGRACARPLSCCGVQAMPRELVTLQVGQCGNQSTYTWRESGWGGKGAGVGVDALVACVCLALDGCMFCPPPPTHRSPGTHVGRGVALPGARPWFSRSRLHLIIFLLAWASGLCRVPGLAPRSRHGVLEADFGRARHQPGRHPGRRRHARHRPQRRVLLPGTAATRLAGGLCVPARPLAALRPGGVRRQAPARGCRPPLSSLAPLGHPRRDAAACVRARGRRRTTSTSSHERCCWTWSPV